MTRYTGTLIVVLSLSSIVGWFVFSYYCHEIESGKDRFMAERVTSIGMFLDSLPENGEKRSSGEVSVNDRKLSEVLEEIIRINSDLEFIFVFNYSRGEIVYETSAGNFVRLFGDADLKKRLEDQLKIHINSGVPGSVYISPQRSFKEIGFKIIAVPLKNSSSGYPRMAVTGTGKKMWRSSFSELRYALIVLIFMLFCCIGAILLAHKYVRNLIAQISFSGSDFRRLFNETPESLIIFDPVSHMIIDSNASMAARLGYSREELVEMPIDRIISVSSGRMVDDAIGIFKTDNIVWATNQQWKMRCGSFIDVEVIGTRIIFKNDYCIIALVRSSY